MSRTVLVSADSPVGRHESTRVLNRYPNGTQLVVTDAPQPLSEVIRGGASEPGEIPVTSGLRLDAPASDIANARSRVPAGEGSRDRTLVSAYVEFIGPPDARWLAKLRQLGIRVLSYQPENSYLCHGPLARFHEAQEEVLTSTGERAINSVVELTSGLKRRLDAPGEDGSTVVIVAAATAEMRDRVIADIRAIDGVQLLQGDGNDVLDENRFRLRARIAADAHAALLKLPSVLSIEPYHAPMAEDEVAGLIVAGLVNTAHRPSGSYRDWLQQHDLDGRGVTIGIVDGGVDVGHPAFSGRVRDLIGGQKDWHATMVAGHAAGNYLDEIDASGFIYGLGTAPAAQILSQDKMQSATFLCRQTARESNGPAIQNNSWGKETRSPMDYGSEEALYDGLVRNADPAGAAPVPLTICFSSGNSGARGLTRPKSAKNVIVTGNSESFRPDVGRDGSDDIREVYSGNHASSHGNCGDGRIRPHIVAPGEWTASANYDCRPGEQEFISPKLTWGGGSSSASPKTAGACALLTQWWQRTVGGANPSPAMLRALVVNGADPIVTGGPIPNNRQGWGRLNISNIIDRAVSRVLVDQTTFLAQPGDKREWTIRAVDPMRPVKITLAWTDPPGPIGSGGSTASSPIVNKLALRAVAGDAMFRGGHDRFRNGVSVPEDEVAPAAGSTLLPEGFDNLQNIFLPPIAINGTVRVSVTALNVTTNCVSGLFDEPKQDFVLVITNATLDTAGGSSNVVAPVAHTGTTPGPSNHGSSTDDERGWWEQGDGNGTRPESARQSSSSPAKVPVRDALTQIKEGFEHCAKECASQVCCGVLVVHRDSQLSDADVDELRTLAARGVLYLVSDGAEALNSVAERIGEQRNIRYRLAATSAELDGAVRDAICEAGGMQRVIVAAHRATNGTSAWIGSFDVVPGDRAITVQVRFGGKPHEVKLSRPGAPPLTWSPERSAAAGPHVTTMFEDDVLQIRDLRADAAPGTWSLHVAVADDEPAPDVAVWAVGGPHISVREGVSVATNDGDTTRRLVKVTAEPNVKLFKATLVPVSGPKASESTRPVVAQATASRLDRQHAEHTRPIAVPELSEIVTMPPGSGTAVVELAVDVLGVDASGHHFARRLKTNLLRVAPRSTSSRSTRKLGKENAPHYWTSHRSEA